MIGRREARGYLIFEVSGRLDGSIYPIHLGEVAPIDRIQHMLDEAGDVPYAIDVRGCRFSGSPSIALFIEAYKRHDRKVPVISADEHLKKILKSTRTDQFVELFENEESLPSIS